MSGVLRVSTPLEVQALGVYIVRFVAGSKGATIALPPAKSCPGARLYVSNHSADAVPITGTTVKTSASLTMNSIPNAKEFGLASDGVDWFAFTN